MLLLHEVPVLGHVLLVLGISNFPISTIFLLNFGTFSTVWYYFPHLNISCEKVSMMITCHCPSKMLLPQRQITRRKLCFYYTCKFGVFSIQYVIKAFNWNRKQGQYEKGHVLIYNYQTESYSLHAMQLVRLWTTQWYFCFPHVGMGRERGGGIAIGHGKN
jgi:hypothetical protein